MRFCVVVGVVVSLLCFPTPTTGQHVACGGHHIHWIGGAPRASFGRQPQDHGRPTRPEPEGMDARDRELWDALVFNAHDYPMPNPANPRLMKGLPLDERRTLVMNRSTVPTIQICLQSADESLTGERLTPYHSPSWWTRQIRRFTNQSWNGTISVGSCTEEPLNGWINVHEGDSEDFAKTGALATAHSWRRYDPHGVARAWVWSAIRWNPDVVGEQSDAFFEKSLAHELGHVLGLSHVPLGSGFVMVSGSTRVGAPITWPDKERWLSQWAYAVGPNVQYPGFIREMPVPVLPFVGLLLLAGLLTTMAWRTSRAKKLFW